MIEIIPLKDWGLDQWLVAVAWGAWLFGAAVLIFGYVVSQ